MRRETTFVLVCKPGNNKQIVCYETEVEHEPPTSGKKPMAVSGIAKVVLGVAMRYWPGMDRPTPPPMTMPSRYEITGVAEVANL